MKITTVAFGNGMAALDALHRYKKRRELRLLPTRELHAGMNEFQRIHGYRVVAYADFVRSFVARPRTDDMRQMVDDVLPLLYG